MTSTGEKKVVDVEKEEKNETGETIISTIIFDVDDTLYDVETGFSAHRNGEIVHQYMVDHLHFENIEHAKKVRNEYFIKYHSTAKALTVAQQEGKFPSSAPTFDTGHLAEYWATHLDYELLGGRKTKLYDELKELSKHHTNNNNDDGNDDDKNNNNNNNKGQITLVAFSNGPRKYVKRVLETLGLFDLFGEERLYAVDDVLPYCKPEKEAFETIFTNINHPSPTSCVMVEDSMKNIRSAKQLGMKTILITGKKESRNRILPTDKPEITDPAVDCSIECIEDLRTTLPGLWQNPPKFC